MRSKLFGLALVGILGVAVNPAHSDPCGMVPPLIMVDSGPPITRVGDQKTYVFHKDGVETMVLRPGFTGKVDEFGMLIPFPSAPAIRKVDDNVFPSISAAIDPPEVTAWVQRRRRRWRRGMGKAASTKRKSADAESAPGDLAFDEVRVVNREAVGMYDVAVIAAGSSKALKKWMDTHGFKYPDGMDEVTQEYVDDKWVFVAVKTQVGQKDGVNPKAGMRKVNSKLPKGATFNGHVQAMGFRFKSKKLVVPMRLSAFNPGKLRNIVYILTDDGVRIKRIPKRFVKRQLSGKQLYKNLTKPLPLRVIGGKYRNLAAWQKQQLKTQRNPKPFNGIAKELFASDLLAVRKGRLSNPIEEKEKGLLAIGERLGLRGAQIDALNRTVIEKDLKKSVKSSLRGLKNMTLTVVDGNFSRETIAKDNLKFAAYDMPKKRNNKKNYDARRQGPNNSNQGGILYHGALGVDSDPDHGYADNTARDLTRGLGLGAFVFVLGFLVLRRKKTGPIALAVLLATSALLAAGAAHAQRSGARSLTSLIRDLGHAKKASEASDIIATAGDVAVDPLLDEIADTSNMTRKGWAIVTLAAIGGDDASDGLEEIHNDSNHEMIVRTWAAAARFKMAGSVDDLLEMTNLTRSFPATGRGFGLQLVSLAGNISTAAEVEKVLLAVSQVPQMQAELGAAVMSVGSKPLTATMMTSKNVNVRRMAAAYLGSLGSQKGNSVAGSVLRALRFDKSADKAPWEGGALFLPAVTWTESDARALAGRLMRWMLWSVEQGKTQVTRQITNNLRNQNLASKAGYKIPDWRKNNPENWLIAWGRAVGKSSVKRMLRQQKLHNKRIYKRAMRKI